MKKLTLISTLILLILAMLISGCNANSNTQETQAATQPATTPVDSVDTTDANAVASAFINAVVTQDGQTAVKYLSKDNPNYENYSMITVENEITRLTNEYNDQSIKETIADGYKTNLKDCSGTIDSVEIDGDTATATFTANMIYTNFHSGLSTDIGYTLNIGTHEATGVINLKKVDSNWIVDTFTLEFVIEDEAKEDETKATEEIPT